MAEVEFPWALDGYCARYGFLAMKTGSMAAFFGF